MHTQFFSDKCLCGQVFSWVAKKFSIRGLVAKYSLFPSSLNYSLDKTITKITYKVNTTACYWKERGKRRQNGTVSMRTFLDSSYNHGPYAYGVCTITFQEAVVINNSSPVDIFGRHSLAIVSKESISISSPLNLDWSPERNRSDMWLGGFCSRDDSVGKTQGKTRNSLNITWTCTFLSIEIPFSIKVSVKYTLLENEKDDWVVLWLKIYLFTRFRPPVCSRHISVAWFCHTILLF